MAIRRYARTGRSATHATITKTTIAAMTSTIVNATGATTPRGENDVGGSSSATATTRTMRTAPTAAAMASGPAQIKRCRSTTFTSGLRTACSMSAAASMDRAASVRRRAIDVLDDEDLHGRFRLAQREPVLLLHQRLERRQQVGRLRIPRIVQPDVVVAGEAGAVDDRAIQLRPQTQEAHPVA